VIDWVTGISGHPKFGSGGRSSFERDRTKKKEQKNNPVPNIQDLEALSRGSNSKGGVKYVRQFQLLVRSIPMWRKSRSKMIG
jgi:hypothetical protein